MKKSLNRTSLDFPRPLVSVDVVIFTVLEDALKVLLTRRPENEEEPFPGLWCIPGGFVDVDRDDSLQDCAARKLQEKTGYAAPYLEQLASWGSASRDPRGWSTTHGYFALVPPPAAKTGDERAEWCDADAACKKRLAFDHREIVGTALERLRSKVEYTSLPAFLLNEPFTLPELQHVYEVVLARPLDKSAFRRRMLDADFLQEVGTVPGAFGRGAMGYKVRERERAAIFPRTFRAVE
ncbi:8-oxo-dGTP diphosphatase [Variovorax sp. HW608]|uniref:NUDIX hydrolase n=1 Tax=Variovorax sp. HW608 TaxID=1034889 RepID=UPI00081F976C|nr:NUDIX domain-containing protein [Variovorax sp. HW608]SCK27196.1 8-oxo-dGTP diphosphatase [Variovorax sp. HW608]